QSLQEGFHGFTARDTLEGSFQTLGSYLLCSSRWRAWGRSRRPNLWRCLSRILCYAFFNEIADINIRCSHRESQGLTGSTIIQPDLAGELSHRGVWTLDAIVK